MRAAYHLSFELVVRRRVVGGVALQVVVLVINVVLVVELRDSGFDGTAELEELVRELAAWVVPGLGRRDEFALA